jgi:hypothetical protein
MSNIWGRRRWLFAHCCWSAGILARKSEETAGIVVQEAAGGRCGSLRPCGIS